LFCSLAKILSSAFLSFLSQHFCVADRKSLSPKTVEQPMEQNAKEKKMDLNSPSAEHGSIVNIKQVSVRRQRWVARTNGGLRFSRPGRSIVKQTADGASFVRLFDAFCC